MSSGKYRSMSAEHREKISTANTGKTMGRQTEEHRRCGAPPFVTHWPCTAGLHRVCLPAAQSTPAAVALVRADCPGVTCMPPCCPVLWCSGHADVLTYICCSKLSESMQKQWQGRKGAERLEKFRAQVLQGCSCQGTSCTQILFVHLERCQNSNMACASCD